MQKLVKISTLTMTRKEWEAQRRLSIGGSDAATVAGLNSYKGRYRLWAEMTGKIIPEDLSEVEAVRLGTDLEDYVAKRFTERTGKKVRRENNILYNPEYPFAHANVDRLIIGEQAGLECKTTSAFNTKHFTPGGFPTNYYCQCQHYMMVTGYSKWYLAVLILGKELRVYEIPRSDEDIAALAAQEEAFFKCVTDDVPPEITEDAASDEAAAVTEVAGVGEDTVIDLTGMRATLEQYQAAVEAQKDATKRVDALKAEICKSMGTSWTGNADGYKVTYKPQERKTFQTKQFEKEHPEIQLDNYYKVSTSRVFRFSYGGQED